MQQVSPSSPSYQQRSTANFGEGQGRSRSETDRQRQNEQGIPFFLNSLTNFWINLSI